MLKLHNVFVFGIYVRVDQTCLLLYARPTDSR